MVRATSTIRPDRKLLAIRTTLRSLPAAGGHNYIAAKERVAVVGLLGVVVMLSLAPPGWVAAGVPVPAAGHTDSHGRAS